MRTRQAALGEGGVDRAENPVRFLIGGVSRDGGFGVRDRLDGVVLTRVEARELGAQLRRPGVEGNGPLVRLDGLVDAADALEVPRQQKVVGRGVRLGTGRSRGRLGPRPPPRRVPEVTP